MDIKASDTIPESRHLGYGHKDYIYGEFYSDFNVRPKYGPDIARSGSYFDSEENSKVTIRVCVTNSLLSHTLDPKVHIAATLASAGIPVTVDVQGRLLDVKYGSITARQNYVTDTLIFEWTSDKYNI